MTTGTAPEPTLAELSDEERYERFDRLQEGMRAVWEIMRRNEEDESVVVIPSVSVDISRRHLVRVITATVSRPIRSG